MQYANKFKRNILFFLFYSTTLSISTPHQLWAIIAGTQVEILESSKTGSWDPSQTGPRWWSSIFAKDSFASQKPINTSLNIKFATLYTEDPTWDDYSEKTWGWKASFNGGVEYPSSPWNISGNIHQDLYRQILYPRSPSEIQFEGESVFSSQQWIQVSADYQWSLSQDSRIRLETGKIARNENISLSNSQRLIIGHRWYGTQTCIGCQIELGQFHFDTPLWDHNHIIGTFSLRKILGKLSLEGFGGGGRIFYRHALPKFESEKPKKLWRQPLGGKLGLTVGWLGETILVQTSAVWSKWEEAHGLAPGNRWYVTGILAYTRKHLHSDKKTSCKMDTFWSFRRGWE